MVFDLKEELEIELQEYFINLLVNNGYEYVEIANQDDLIRNFKKQLELFNNKSIYNFGEIYSYLCRDDGISKFDKLKNPFNGVSFIDFSRFSSNIFQVAQEVQIQGEYLNRYDVTILVNGIPLVQVELKRSGVELKIAFNQIQRYDNQSYSGLYEFVQIFVISNKVHTRYFFNDSNYDYNSTYVWKDAKDLESFTNSFLIQKNLISFLNEYIFKNPFSDEYLMIRPYQEEIIDKISNQISLCENAYVWMSYNTGKSITSLKLAQNLKDSHQVIYITQNHLSDYPAEYVVNSHREFLEVIGIQNLIITNIYNFPRRDEDLELIKDNTYIFIFDDYEKHYEKYFPDKLIKTFSNSLFYCFTSAPVFNENLICARTTKAIFNKSISSYNFKDALLDVTNLPLDVEYVGDEDISEGHDLSSKVRIDGISENILKNYDKKTINHQFKSILITSSNDDLIRYYKNLKNDLNVAPILRFNMNDIHESKPVRDYFEQFVNDYNQKFGADISHRKTVNVSRISDDLESDIIKRFKTGEIDLLLVDASMFKDEYNLNILGNLKNPQLNTIYLDCVLNYEELFEALTMVNGVGETQKTQGNVVLFQNLNENISKTIKLYSSDAPDEDYLIKDYDYYLNKYNEHLSKIKDTTDFIDDYENLSKYYHILKSLDEFDFTQSQIDEFNTYKDSYDHEILKINESKKNIQKFNPEVLNHYTIDLNYIESLDDVEIAKSKSLTSEVTNENTFNITNENNYSQEFRILNKTENNLNVLNNNQDLSKTVNVKNEYHIHIGGDNIPEKNINHDLGDLIIELNSNNELSKVCPVCGKKHPSEFNYCPDHEDLIELEFESDLIKHCRQCGARYRKEYNYCRYCECDEPLMVDVMKIQTRPNKYYNFNSYPNSYSQIDDLLTEENTAKLNEFNFSQLQFDIIISNIKDTYKQIFEKILEEFNINADNLTLMEKMFLFAKSFVKTDYKEGGGDLGYFKFNEIYIDDRAPNALQITTIIHELSHFILAEILEQIVSQLLNTDKTDVVEAFVCYNLARDYFNYLVDEYCAHTVEGRFATLGYQDYGSYESALTNFKKEYPEDLIEVAIGVGNTFAYYIKDIMTSFIDDGLREEIKDEFTKINSPPMYSGLKYETSEVYDWQRFSKAMQIMLTKNIEEITINPHDMENYTIKFRKNNQG